MGNLSIGDKVRHLGLGWTGTVLATRFEVQAEPLVQVQAVGGHGPRWFHENEFKLADAPDPDPMIGVARRATAMQPRDRYLRDPKFHWLVDTMRAAIEGGEYTPTEVREAALLAQVIYEERTVRRPVYPGCPEPSDPRD